MIILVSPSCPERQSEVSVQICVETDNCIGPGG
jgi:hypothetical protein